jgi:hypothetical protein
VLQDRTFLTPEKCLRQRRNRRGMGVAKESCSETTAMTKTTLVLQALPHHDVPPAPPTPTNEALMARIQEHDGEALWMLYKRHSALVRSTIARCLNDEEAGDDVLREVFEEIRDRADHYTPDKGRVLGWILTLARRRAVERARYTRVARQREHSHTREHATAASGESRRRGFEIDFRGLRDWIREAVA